MRRRELNHLSTYRKRNRRDSRSSGERKGKSLNLICVIGVSRCRLGVVGFYVVLLTGRSEVTKLMHSGRALERSAREGDSPVREMQVVF